MRIHEITDPNRRSFMKNLGKTALGTTAAIAGMTALPTSAWPQDVPKDFDFMDQYFSDKILKDPKYQEFKLMGKDFLELIQQMKKKQELRQKQKDTKSDSIET
tara:strand:- start:1441 stop:1749 length:309 start_codon:yes stop_codon:yes gene_type:complete